MSSNNKKSGGLLNQINSLLKKLMRGNAVNVRCHCICQGRIKQDMAHPECQCYGSNEASIRFIKDQSIPKNSHCLSHQSFIDEKDRRILFDWVCKVTTDCKYSRITYYLTCQIIDRFLSSTSNFIAENMELLGITCICIAGKFEEVFPSRLDDLMAFSNCWSYEKEDVYRMETIVLDAIGWDTSLWTPIHWVYSFVHMLKYDFSTDEMKIILHLLDISIFDHGSTCFSYSTMAASALYLAAKKTPIPINVEYKMAECSRWMYPYLIGLDRVSFNESISSRPNHCCVLLKNLDLTIHYIENITTYEEIKSLEQEYA